MSWSNRWKIQCDLNKKWSAGYISVSTSYGGWPTSLTHTPTLTGYTLAGVLTPKISKCLKFNILFLFVCDPNSTTTGRYGVSQNLASFIRVFANTTQGKRLGLKSSERSTRNPQGNVWKRESHSRVKTGTYLKVLGEARGINREMSVLEKKNSGDFNRAHNRW